MTAAIASGRRRWNRNRCATATHAYTTWIQDRGHGSRFTPHSAHPSLCCEEDGALHAPVRGVHEPPQAILLRLAPCRPKALHPSMDPPKPNRTTCSVSSPHPQSLSQLPRPYACCASRDTTLRREQGSSPREAPWRPAAGTCQRKTPPCTARRTRPRHGVS
jgi:hypothetical protein